MHSSSSGDHLSLVVDDICKANGFIGYVHRTAAVDQSLFIPYFRALVCFGVECEVFSNRLLEFFEWSCSLFPRKISLATL